MNRLRLTLAYDGAAFAGSQIQPEQRTVQGDIERALTALDGQMVRAVFAGRTDAGVHAVGQVAHADVHRVREPERWRQGLNGILPPDVRVTNVTVVPGGFHARYDAVGRQYRYLIWNGAVLPPLARGTMWHWRSPLDVAAMNAAARVLIGRHDFAAFAGDGKGLPQRDARTTRTLWVAEWTAERRPEAIAGLALMFTIEGDGFLPHMVRNLVGSLVRVGMGAAPANWMEMLLQARDRRLAAPTAPPHGLVLWLVRYRQNRNDGEDIRGETDADNAGEMRRCRH